MGIGSHDDGNGVADSPCYQNDGVAQLNAEGNMTVSQVMNANIRQIGELSAAGQLLVERCARHVEYAVVRGQPVEPGTVGAELFGQPMRNRHIAVSAFLAVLSGAEDVLPLFSVVGLVDTATIITVAIMAVALVVVAACMIRLGYKALLAEWAIEAITKAEKEFVGTKLGEARLAVVVSWLRAKVPAPLRFLVTDSMIQKVVQMTFNAAKAGLEVLKDA